MHQPKRQGIIKQASAQTTFSKNNLQVCATACLGVQRNIPVAEHPFHLPNWWKHIAKRLTDIHNTRNAGSKCRRELRGNSTLAGFPAPIPGRPPYLYKPVLAPQNLVPYGRQCALYSSRAAVRAGESQASNATLLPAAAQAAVKGTARKGGLAWTSLWPPMHAVPDGVITAQAQRLRVSIYCTPSSNAQTDPNCLYAEEFLPTVCVYKPALQHNSVLVNTLEAGTVA